MNTNTQQHITLEDEDLSAPLALTKDGAVVALCTSVLPVWGRHLETSRAHSEAAVAEMLSAFAEIWPHLNMATRQSQQITEALAQGDGGMTQLAQACDEALRPLMGAMDASAAAVVGQVIAMIQSTVDGLEKIAKPFDRETQLVSRQVDRMYVGFQYQDRISQMMALLHTDMQRLNDAIADDKTAPDALGSAFWLSRLESQYAMAEQRKDHRGEAPTRGDASGDANDDSIFF